MSKILTGEDFARAAAVLGCDVAAIKAVAEVESRGDGFLSDGVTPRILFEAHQFHARTGGVYGQSHPNISSSTWNRALYAKGNTPDERGMKEHKRLVEAIALNRDAALKSASWGKFQIMGFNYAAAGFDDLQYFIDAMYRSEGAHLDAFVAFVRTQHLDIPLRQHNWAAFAKGYNGSEYRQNNYDGKLATAYAKFKQLSFDDVQSGVDRA